MWMGDVYYKWVIVQGGSCLSIMIRSGISGFVLTADGSDETGALGEAQWSQFRSA